MFRQKDVTGIATVHHALRDIDSRTSNVCPIIDIGNLIDGPAVNTHAYFNMRVTFQRLANFQRALRGLLWAAEKSSAIPSPVGTRMSLPVLSAARKHSVL